MSGLRERSACPDGYRALSTAELRELLRDDGKMDRIVRLDQKFQDLQVDREALLTSNRSLAEESLARRPRLLSGKVQLVEKYRELSNLATACLEKQSQLEAQVKKQNLQAAQNLLQEEVSRAEDQSEELLEKFMEGSVGLDGFLDSFQSSRKTYHVRRAQAEKMQEAIRARHPPGKGQQGKETEGRELSKDSELQQEVQQEVQRPNGFLAQTPLRVFQVRYGLTPAILLPHYPAPTQQPGTAQPEPPPGQTRLLCPAPSLTAHGQPVGLRVIGQLPGGWPAGRRPVRLQQLYRPLPPQPEPPFR